MIGCPSCGCPTTVTETRSIASYTRRRRRCDSVTCNQRVTTVEIIVNVGPGRMASMDDPVLISRVDLREIARLAQRAVDNRSVVIPAIHLEDLDQTDEPPGDRR